MPMTTYTPGEIEEMKLKIDGMSHLQMAYLHRFAAVGHPFFDSKLPLHEHFEKRFKEFGGMTPEISKEIGWEG